MDRQMGAMDGWMDWRQVDMYMDSGAICEQEVREEVLMASRNLEIPSFPGFGTPPGTHRRRAQDPGPAKTEGSAGPGPGSWARCLCTIS